ncbi:hypothetical protein AXF42_Ash011248 [Apostasia shenzhenica]|uniref:Uncharacterized protein n=1 Tax=Apostasia shenzhenica TaxID=1088818 RepID=A0A2I0AL77_9ASPA|nr:hypothetical protein AXF42_Ash011248 [Apostasia shenzhenica]
MSRKDGEKKGQFARGPPRTPGSRRREGQIGPSARDCLTLDSRPAPRGVNPLSPGPNKKALCLLLPRPLCATFSWPKVGAANNLRHKNPACVYLEFPQGRMKSYFGTHVYPTNKVPHPATHQKANG